jgi:hypothetical protein
LGPKVFEDFTFAIVNQTGSLDIFSHLLGKRKQKLPSFVPDFTGSVSNLPSFLDRLYNLRHYRASGDTSAVFNLIAPGKAVTRGVILDKIKATEYFDINVMQHLAEIGHEDGSPYKFTGESIRTAFGHTMCASLVPSSDCENNNLSIVRVVKPLDLSIFEKWRAWEDASSAARDSLFDNDIDIFNSIFLMASTGRRFVKTRKGRIGFAPRRCHKGDLIAVLAGVECRSFFDVNVT